MTSEERAWAAINLQEPDRTPVSLPLSNFAGAHAGISLADYSVADAETIVDATYKTFIDLGGFDVFTTPAVLPGRSSMVATMKRKMPGKDLPDNYIPQVEDIEMMTPDDYDFIIKNGWNQFRQHLVLRTNPEFGTPEGKIKFQRLIMESQRADERALERERRLYADKDVVQMGGIMGGLPFEMFAMTRTLNKFLVDLFRLPDKVLAAMDVYLDETIDICLGRTKALGTPFVFTNGGLCSNAFISPTHFEKFALPYYMKLAEAYTSQGLVLMLILDQDFNNFLHYFRELPKGRYIMHLDGYTDIFKAKEMLGDRMCIMGDVPPSLLTLGTHQEVEKYCQKLIDVVGKGGGFILSTYSIPYEAKFENVKAIVDTAKNYRTSR